MDDIELLDAIERYRNGEMAPGERIAFEEQRKNNADIDHMVVEHLFFLQQMQNAADIKDFSQKLDEVGNRLANEGIFTGRSLKTSARVVNLWKLSRRNIAVAATIAGIVSIFTAGMFTEYKQKKSEKTITPLVDYKFRQVDAKFKAIEKKLDLAALPATVPAKPQFEADFRATGFLIDASGYIATNAHVINKAKNLIVENKGGDQFLARPIYISNSTDLAILKITDTSFKKFSMLPYSIRRSPAELGEQIFTLGYPRDEVVYGEGYLSAKSGYSGDTSAYQVSVSVNPGNSGGPLINKNGEVIGIISSKETNADGVVFAIKSKNIYTALEEINRNEDIKLPLKGTIKGLDRVQQIKKIEDCVFMVKGN